MPEVLSCLSPRQEPTLSDGPKHGKHAESGGGRREREAPPAALRDTPDFQRQSGGKISLKRGYRAQLTGFAAINSSVGQSMAEERVRKGKRKEDWRGGDIQRLIESRAFLDLDYEKETMSDILGE